MASAGRLARSEHAPVTFVVFGSLAIAAWVVMIHHTGGARFAGAFAMWNVMMVAMMLPSLASWLGLLPPLGAAIFSAGYFSVWAAYCAGAAILQVHLNGAILAPRASGLLLVAAGVFELTPLKAACLRRCRSPIGLLLTRWRSGRSFLFRVGLDHGLNCLGCCWALMALAFALGVANLWWMAALTTVVAIEKLAPWGERASRALGVALIGWGALVALVPA